jgi:hypothetical protein
MVLSELVFHGPAAQALHFALALSSLFSQDSSIIASMTSLSHQSIVQHSILYPSGLLDLEPLNPNHTLPHAFLITICRVIRLVRISHKDIVPPFFKYLPSTLSPTVNTCARRKF